MIIPENLAAASAMNGFKNYSTATFSTSIPTQTLTVGSFVSVTTSTPLNNTNSISQVQVLYGGLSTKTFVIYGSLQTFWTAGQYEVGSLYYFDSVNLNVFTYVANQTAGSITIPTITINCRGFPFLAPF